ncbi:MetQ/NlpA family ABC transporter substrate-binding protein [Clostridium tyrobutyricum]|uniref:MetQ/NlpA family ABC transporter substrate-binding protein n=1 Tax=Clostridium tyrobutyricum TaxID=1519 RepID=UPI001C389421|nr:MetQ/NlpA family ABC transporter substrate-binding protein [Clostridium tyrobutyricum]MBV4418138.1 MetQ/NlpA family ABC transporter substrate-binding protein [Clostridium tyrobutyricum]
MKKKIVTLLFCVILLGGIFTGCNSKNTETSNSKTLKIGAVATPHAEILNHIKPTLKAEGINLDVIVFDDSAQLNPALKDKQIDANYFQHKPYLDSVASEKGFDFSSVGNIHVEPIGFYSKKIKSINELKDGATIAIPNDASNEYRALLLLQKQGLIKVKNTVSNKSATINDIAENPRHLKIEELDAYQIPRSLPDIDGGIINTNIVLQSKIDPNSALFKEDKDSPYANIIVVRKGDENRDAIKKLVKALQSDDVKKFIKEKYKGSVVPAF